MDSQNGAGSRLSSLGTAEEHAAVYAAVVASALDAVVVVDESGCVVTMNPAAETTFGYSLDEALGQSIGALIVPEHLRAAHEQGFARYRATREPRVLGRRVELEARCKDGRIIPVELAITEVNLSDRRLFTANLRDLSAAKESAAEIERQRDQLHQSEKLSALGSLLAGIAHELNNPLSIVLGQAVMMREDVEELYWHGPFRERTQKIEAAAERCARVMKSFLAIARQRKAERKMLPLAPLLDSAIDLLMYGMRTGGITITRDYAGPLPDVFADSDQVQQIVVNLLVNASQALDHIEGDRHILVRAAAGPDKMLHLLVADNGPGVAKEIAARIFDPFFTTKAEGAGTGIGLSVSRGLAQSQGGRLSLALSPLGGAGFELTLPTVPVTTESVSNGRSEDLIRFSAKAVQSAEKRRALIVDDEVEIGVLIAETLRNANYQCDVARSGREAQAKIAARAGAYDAVVCDLRMPDIDGPALFDWIGRHHPALAERTMFVTGDALGPAAGRFLAQCHRPVLEKPFAPADIVRLVGELPSRDTAR
jgi:PAS domain S-box-containing protein